MERKRKTFKKVEFSSKKGVKMKSHSRLKSDQEENDETFIPTDDNNLTFPFLSFLSTYLIFLFLQV